MKKTISIVLILSLALLSLFAQGEKEAAAGSSFKIAFISTGGTILDQASNQGQYTGLLKFAEAHSDVEYKTLELAEVIDVDASVRQLAAEGYKVFYFCNADSSALMDDICPDFPDRTFIVYNGTNKTGHSNLTNTTVDIGETAFVCGIFATLMNEKITGERACGYIGGVRNPNLERARYAMQAAAYLLGGDFQAAYIGNFTDGATGTEIARQMHSKGIHIIQAWAGGANLGIFKAAETAGDGYFSMGGADGQFRLSESIIASLATRFDELVFQILTKAYEGTLQAGSYPITLTDGTIDCIFAPDSRADIIPQDVRDEVAKYRAMIISGEMKAPRNEDEYKVFESLYLSK